jgi:hypothetical protein
MLVSLPAPMRGLGNRARAMPDFVPPTCIHNRAPQVARLCGRPLAELDRRTPLRPNACETGGGRPNWGRALSPVVAREPVRIFAGRGFCGLIDQTRERAVGSMNLPAPTQSIQLYGYSLEHRMGAKRVQVVVATRPSLWRTIAIALQRSGVRFPSAPPINSRPYDTLLKSNPSLSHTDAGFAMFVHVAKF